MNSLVTFFILSLSFNSFGKLPCSNNAIIRFASNLASNSDFSKSQTGLNILLSLQSEDALKALRNLKTTGEANHEIWDFYIAHYFEKPKEDNATDVIEYFDCKKIQKLMKEK